MTVFSKLASGARAAHAHFFGTKTGVTLTEAGSAARTVEVVLGTESIETRREDNRDVRYTVRECRFVTLSTVRHDAIVVIGTERWAIDQFKERQASGLTVILRRTQVTDANRPSYRGKG